MPSRDPVFEMILEEEGVIGQASLLELPLSLVSLDADVASLQLPEFLRDCFLHGDQTLLPWVAKAVAQVVNAAGGCRDLRGVGACSRMVASLLARTFEGDAPAASGPGLEAVVLVDRTVDMVDIACGADARCRRCARS